MDPIRERLHDPEVLTRLNAFIISYFGWVFFGMAYSVIGRWSVNVTNEFLRLPLTSRSLVVGLINFTDSIPPLHALLAFSYYIGFTGSIAFAVIYLLFYLRDLEASDRLLTSYVLAYLSAGAIYMMFHIYSPHMVYHLRGFTSSNTLFTRQEFVFPSLHNTIITVNIIILWKYRHRWGGRILILLNALIPFATVMLGHHWVYDVLGGFALGTAVTRVSSRRTSTLPQKLYRLEAAYLRKITMINVVLAIILFIIALEPERAAEIINGLMSTS